MISISDAARFSEESNATRKFKAWWETVIDYLILGLLIITLFSWSKVVTAEASGLICITTQSNIAYSYNLAKYLNSRCAQKFDDKAFIHFPYLLFMQWLILSVIQKLWLKLPMVQNRFETFIELFTSLKENESTPHNQAWSTLTRNETLERNSILFILYTTKVITTTISSLIILCLLIAWTSTLKFFKTDFECHIPKINPPAVTSLVCNFQPAQYIYVTIMTNIMIQTTITFVGLYASYFCVRRKWERHYKIDKSLRRMKAFKDLCFCICFFKTSVQERQQILYALSNHSIQINNKMADVTNTTVNTHDLKTIKNVCDFLGLEMNKRSNEDSLKSFQGRLNGNKFNFFTIVSISRKILIKDSKN